MTAKSINGDVREDKSAHNTTTKVSFSTVYWMQSVSMRWLKVSH